MTAARSRATALALARRRQHNLRLTGAPLAAPADVVDWLLAVQAQDHAPATWSVAQRTGGASAAAVQAAFDAGTILRTHVLRPTWHFVRPADLRWLLTLTAPRIRRLLAPYDRKLELDARTLAKAHAVIARALEGGPRTRGELVAALTAAKIRSDGGASANQRLAHILMHAELDALIVSGPMRAKQHTHARVDARVPPAPAIPRDEALARLATRYFAGHGPATAKDLAWWASLTLTDVRHAIGLAGDALVREEHDGVAYWSAADAAAPPRRSRAPVVHLLQAYDEYAVGYTQSKYLLDVSGAARRHAPDGRAARMHLLALDTQLVGRWQRVLAKDAVTIEVLLHTPLDRAGRRALDAAAARFGAFVAQPARLVVTPA